MKIAYLTQYDARNIHSWSGSGFNIAKCLSDQGVEIEYLGPLKNRVHVQNALKYVWNNKLLRKHDHPQRDPAFLKSYGRQATRLLPRSSADLVLTTGSMPLSYVQTNLPVVLWSDCTFASMLDYYPAFSNLSERTIRNGHSGESLAIQNTDRMLFTSDWAASSAISYYGADPSKVNIIPFGSNMDAAASEIEVDTLIAERVDQIGTRIQLFCSGVDWFRKGIDIAIAVVEYLRRDGLPCELVVAGCSPPPDVDVPDFVKVVGFISKNSTDGLDTLVNYYRTSHLLLLPTRAECFGLVFCEAASFALPSVTTETGGTRSAMDGGRCGALLPEEASIAEWATSVKELLETPERYRSACRSAYSAYRDKLNWSKAGEAVLPLLEALLNRS